MYFKLSKQAMVLKQFSRNLTTGYSMFSKKESYKFVVAGGGAGGLSIASFLSRKFPNQVAVIEPNDYHYYQPMWTLVGAGLKDLDESIRSMSTVMPRNVKWIKENAVKFDPRNNSVLTQSDRQIEYDYLIVALGIQLQFDKLPGLTEALGTDGVGCIYSVETVKDTFRALQKFNGGEAFFTLAATPVKCLGAPQKIMYLADEIFRKNGCRDKSNLTYKTPAGFLFAVEKYRNSLMKVCQERDIKVDLFRHLIEIDASRKEVTFEYTDDVNTPRKTENLKYDFIHVTPPMGPYPVLKESLLADDFGFVNVDKETCQHVTYQNVFSLGDCSNLPNSKTAAAVAAQSKVIQKNLISLVDGKPLNEKYNGYASCPLVTSSKTCILAEFDYSGLPRETFPIDQGIERRSMYYLKANVMPEIYWNLLLRGYWHGPEPARQLMHFGKVY